MFKPLLRTIPALSGNVKIVCSLTDYNKLSQNEFNAYVRFAKLHPLSSVLSQRNIEINLLTSSYDYDLKRYYKYYSQYFFDPVYEYDKKNFILLDKSDTQKNRNTDFEFGCKRISYLKSDKQFAFYTPIYIESLEDLPDYFKVKITLKNNKYQIEKEINIKISDEYKYNYLRIYLNRYLEKLDSNVIFCNTGSKQATYYGIDLLKGGFTRCVDNLIAKIYTNQNTINNFDSIISSGFERNNICIRQILPLCWIFNINDILTDDEKNKFKNSQVYISGIWYKNNEIVHFYDIDMNYQYLYDKPYLLNINNGLFTYKNTMNNLLNMEYPSLNESMYINYRYSNKVNKKYNRWKLKYSSDEHPYITNLSPAFSINRGSTYKYGEFPERYSSLNVITDVNNNMILPIGNSLKNEDSPYFNNYALVNNYVNIMNNNVSTWYTLTNDLKDIFNQDIWTDVIDNKTYYKGILYKFDNLYNEDVFDLYKFDKFSVIVNLHFDKLKDKDLENIKKADISLYTSPKYITDKTICLSERIPEGLSSGEFNKLPSLYNTLSTKNNAQMVFDKLYIKAEDSTGDFIDMLSLGFNIYDVNSYYKYSDIVKNFNIEHGFYDDIIEVLKSSENFNTYFIDGYEMLPISKLKNILHENNRDILFESKRNTRWILDNLYFSQHGNYYKTKYDRDTLVKLIKEYGEENNMIPLFIKCKFIAKSYLISILHDYYKDAYSQYEDIFNYLVEYRYYPRVKDETSATYASDLFIKRNLSLGDNYGNYIPSDKVDNDVLYVDTYNLNNVINKYNQRYHQNIKEISDEIETFAKFLNMKHILYYISDLYKNADSEINLKELFDSLYLRKRLVINHEEISDLDFKDYYIHISQLYDKFRPLTHQEKKDIINGTLVKHIYKKVDNHYSNSAYKYLGESNNDYHFEDFYFIPQFYVQTNVGTMMLLSDYLRNNIDSIDTEILENNNFEDVLSISIDKDSSIDDIKETLNVSERNANYLKKKIKSLINNIKDNIYYKVHDTDEPIKYNNYTGINDYIILSDPNLKTDILDNKDRIITYVIDENGNFVRKEFDKDIYYVLREESDEDYNEYMNDVISNFASDIHFYEKNNYYKFSEHYYKTHNEDDLVDIPDLDGEYNSKFTFEVVYKKNFVKLNKNLYDLIGLENNIAYKDLYIYKIYQANEYPADLRIYYSDKDVPEALDITSCLYPLFNDIHLQEKKYSVIYSEYNQANIYKVSTINDNYYRYNQSDITCMYDISTLPKDKEYEIIDVENGKHTLCYTYDYWWELTNEDNPLVENHEILPTYKLLNSCYSTPVKFYDTLNLFDEFSINSYISQSTYTYSYTYIKSEVETSGSYNIIVDKEYEGIGTGIAYTTYGFIILDTHIDNTNVSFNIVDDKYKKKKFFTSVNEHNIYDSNYNIQDTFNLMVPFSNINLFDTFTSYYSKIFIKPNKFNINTYYKQTPIIDDSGITYAYSINYRPQHIDVLTLQRYFDSIVPNIKKTNVLESTYCLKYKNYKYQTENIDYINDIFYTENVNIYNYNKLRVYNTKNTYTLFEPVEYKHLNDNKLINLNEEFTIDEPGKFTYDELIIREKENYVLEKFKNYILLDKLNDFDDDQILFLYNRYHVDYNTECIGLNNMKTEKLYTLKYKFTLL